jgi:hypothetical protein
MTSNTIKSLFAVLPLAALLLAPSSASAQDYADQEVPPPPPAVQPVYTAPLSQTTQTTYVPQSVALSGPEEIDETEGRPVPVGYSAVKRTRLGMLIGGGVTFGVSYMYAVMFAAAGSDEARYDNYDGSSGTNEMAALWIPVAGPFIQAAQEDSATGRVLLLGLGAAETVGAVMLYYGLTTKKTVFVRNDLVGNMRLTPMASDGATGMMLSGQF